MDTNACIRVLSLPDNITKTQLQDHFASAQNGGGEIKQILHPYDQMRTQALVEFFNPLGLFILMGTYIIYMDN